MIFGKLVNFGRKSAPETFKAKYVKPPRPDSLYPMRDKDDPEVGHYPVALLNIRPGITLDEVTAKLREAIPGAGTHWVFDHECLGLGYLEFPRSTLAKITYRTDILRGPVSIEGLKLPMTLEQARAALKDLKVNEAQLAHDTYCEQGKREANPVYASSAGEYDIEISFHRGLLSLLRIYPRHTQAEREAKTRQFLEFAMKRDELAGRKNEWKSEGEPDKLLSSWAKWTAASGEGSKTIDWFCSRLKAATPDEWQSVAQEWNWDQDIAPLYWIIRQPQCDKATALTIFFRASPEDAAEDFASPKGLKQKPGEAYGIAVEIQDRWNRGLYTRSEIAFDKSESDYLQEYAAHDNPFILPSMCRGLAGREINPPYTFFRDCPHLKSPFFRSSFSTSVLSNR